MLRCESSPRLQKEVGTVCGAVIQVGCGRQVRLSQGLRVVESGCVAAKEHAPDGGLTGEDLAHLNLVRPTACCCFLPVRLPCIGCFPGRRCLMFLSNTLSVQMSVQACLRLCRMRACDCHSASSIRSLKVRLSLFVSDCCETAPSHRTQVDKRPRIRVGNSASVLVALWR
jgi:hypothetical protein